MLESPCDSSGVAKAQNRTGVGCGAGTGTAEQAPTQRMLNAATNFTACRTWRVVCPLTVSSCLHSIARIVTEIFDRRFTAVLLAFTVIAGSACSKDASAGGKTANGARAPSGAKTDDSAAGTVDLGSAG